MIMAQYEDPTSHGSVSLNPTHETSQQLTHLIDDDVFALLKRRFHRKGQKGRPPDLPQGLLVTNKLLLQLYFLKGAEYSNADLKNWLEDIDPTTVCVTEGRIVYCLDKILQHCRSLELPETLQDYLAVVIDFHGLPQPLAELGLNRQHFSNNIEYASPPQENISNSVVFELDKYRSVNQETLSFTYRWLRTLCVPCSSLSDKQLHKRIQTVVSRCKSFSKMKDSEGLHQYLELLFFNQENPLPSVPVHKSVPNSLERSCKNCREVTQLRNDIIDLKRQLSVKEEMINVDLPRYRNENSKLESTVKDLKNQLKEMKKVKDQLCKENEEIKTSNLYKKMFHINKV